MLVNNAGIVTAKPFLELTVDDFDLTFAVDVRASFLLAQAGREADARTAASIVNITSVHEHIPRPGLAVYAAAKAALGMLSRSLALELAERNIRVNSVAPGVIATPRNEGDAERRSTPRCRSAAPASRKRSRRSSPGSAPTRPRTSPARATSSTAA